MADSAHFLVEWILPIVRNILFYYLKIFYMYFKNPRNKIFKSNVP